MAKEPKPKSILYLERQPARVSPRAPSYLSATQWRYAAKEPTNLAYQTHLMRALKLEYKFIPKKGKDSKDPEVKKVIEYYDELFYTNNWSTVKTMWEKDSYDLPFGGALEIGWWPKTAFGGKFPAGYPAWFIHVDGGTMWISSDTSKYPFMQVNPNDNADKRPFKRNEIARLMYLPHPDLQHKGYQYSPTEQNYQVIEALSRLYTFDIKSMSDTPIAGILDLMDFKEEDALEWAIGFKEMMMGIDPIKIPILYEHEKQAKFVPFGQVTVDVAEKWKHYAEKAGNPYGLTIGSLGLYEHDRTLAGARVQRITTQRTGVGGFAWDERNSINRQLFPPGCPIMYEWDVPEIEDKLKLEQARGVRAAYMKAYVDAGALHPEDMLEQAVEDNVFTIKPRPGVIEPGIGKPVKPPKAEETSPKAPRTKKEYPEYPPAMKAMHVVEETLLLKQDVGDDLEQTKAFKNMQETLADAFQVISGKSKITALVKEAKSWQPKTGTK